jgi:hypothetical protein
MVCYTAGNTYRGIAMMTLFGLLAPWIILARQLAGGGAPEIPTEAYYTVDDGITWFADDINKIPPFDKDGKPAYRVHVFRCADGKEFVSHLERYTPEARKKLEEARAQGDQADPAVYEEVSMTGIEVKKPGTGDSGWVKQSDYERAAKITMPQCADGTLNGIEPVYPE